MCHCSMCVSSVLFHFDCVLKIVFQTPFVTCYRVFAYSFFLDAISLFPWKKYNLFVSMVHSTAPQSIYWTVSLSISNASCHAIDEIL